MWQQVDKKIAALAAFGQNADFVGRAAQVFQLVDGKLAAEDNVAQLLLTLQLRYFHPNRTLDPRFVMQQIEFILSECVIGGGRTLHYEHLA